MKNFVRAMDNAKRNEITPWSRIVKDCLCRYANRKASEEQTY